MARNLFNFWVAGKTWKSTEMNLLVQLPYLVLALIGTALSIVHRRFRTIAPMILLIVYLIGVSMPILAQARYSIPVLPFVSILACIGLIQILKKVHVLPKPSPIAAELVELTGSQR